MREYQVLLVHGDSFHHVCSMVASQNPHAIVTTKTALHARCSCLVFFDRDAFEFYQRGALMAPAVNIQTSIL